MMGTGQVTAQAAVALAGVAMVGNCGSQVGVLVWWEELMLCWWPGLLASRLPAGTAGSLLLA